MTKEQILEWLDKNNRGFTQKDFELFKKFYEESTKELQELYKKADDNWWNAQQTIKELQEQIEKMKKYIKTCWFEENLNDYSSYITNTSDEFRDLVKELNDEVRNGR